MSRKLFLRKPDVSETTDCYFEPLLPNLPFSEGGRIFQIGVVKSVDGDRELSYYQIFYKYDGTVSQEKVMVPKRKGKNLGPLLENWYADLKVYLDLNGDKYFEYKSSRMKKKIDKKKVYARVGVSTLLVVAAAPIFVSTAYVGAIIESCFLLLLYMSNDFKNRVEEDERKCIFIEEYDKRHRMLVEYQAKRPKQRNVIGETKYTEISSVNRTNDKGNNNTLIRRKETA